MMLLRKIGGELSQIMGTANGGGEASSHDDVEGADDGSLGLRPLLIGN